MKQKLLLLLFVIQISVSLHAQQIDIKAGGGVHQMHCFPPDIEQDFETKVQSPQIHFTAGADIGFNLSGNHWLYTGLSGNLQRFQQSYSDNPPRYQSLTLALPVLYQYRMNNFSISIGTNISALLYITESYYNAQTEKFSYKGHMELKDIYDDKGWAELFRPIKTQFTISPAYQISDKLQVYMQMDLFYHRISFTYTESLGSELITAYVKYLSYWAAVGIKYNLYKPEKYLD